MEPQNNPVFKPIKPEVNKHYWKWRHYKDIRIISLSFGLYHTVLTVPWSKHERQRSAYYRISSGARQLSCKLHEAQSLGVSRRQKQEGSNEDSRQQQQSCGLHCVWQQKTVQCTKSVMKWNYIHNREQRNELSVIKEILSSFYALNVNHLLMQVHIQKIYPR